MMAREYKFMIGDFNAIAGTNKLYPTLLQRRARKKQFDRAREI
jgi:hypothetical protein